MENQNKTRGYYLKEFEHFDGEYYITFNILNINFDNQTITVAVSKAGKISVIEFDLYGSEDDCYFEYGPMLEHIYVNDFESIREKYLGE